MCKTLLSLGKGLVSSFTKIFFQMFLFFLCIIILMAVEHFFGLYTQQDGYEVESYFLVSANYLFSLVLINFFLQNG